MKTRLHMGLKQLIVTAMTFLLVIGQMQPSVAATVSQNDMITAETANTDVLYSGVDGNIQWSIDSTGHLMITGTGNYTMDTKLGSSTYGYPQWCAYWEEIYTATVQISDITCAEAMFGECKNLQSVDLSGFDASKVTNMYYMFGRCNSLNSINFGNIDTGNVTDMHGMFYECKSLETLNLDMFNTENVTDMQLMFGWCTNLKRVNLSSFRTTSLIYMTDMFYRCLSLESVDLRTFDLSSMRDTRTVLTIFDDCQKLIHVAAPSQMAGYGIELPITYRIDTYETSDSESWIVYNKTVNEGIVTKISAAQGGMTFARVDGAHKPEGVYSVQVNGAKESYLTLAEGSETQPYVDGAMETIVYQAFDGYYIPEDYVTKLSGLTSGALSGVTVVRCDETKLTISGTPTAETEITLVPIMKKVVVTEEPATEEPVTAPDSDVTKTPVITEETIIAQTDDKDMEGASFGLLKAKAAKNRKTSITLKWSKVKDADGYIIYGNRCNAGGKKYSYKKMTTLSKNQTSYTAKMLKKGTYYKFLVAAYKNVDGKQVILTVSPTIHSITQGGKYGVAKSVKIQKVGTKKNTTKVTLKKGKAAQIKATEVKESKKIKQHRKIVYESSNTKVATVTKSGKIRAKGKGACKIYVYAQNGIYKTISVTVK